MACRSEPLRLAATAADAGGVVNTRLLRRECTRDDAWLALRLTLRLLDWLWLRERESRGVLNPLLAPLLVPLRIPAACV
jgi:hypothetical protein